MALFWLRTADFICTRTLCLLATYFAIGNADTAGQTTIPSDLQSLSKMTLYSSPTLVRNHLQVQDAETEIQRAHSAFDVHLSSGINANRTNINLVDADPRNQHLQSSLIGKSGDFYIASQKKFRTGTVANIRTNYTGASSNYPFNAYNEMVGAYHANHESSATLTVTQPILKGAGTRANMALINSAAYLLEGTLDSYRLGASYEVLGMTNAYWQYLSAFKALEIFRQNEDRIREVLSMTAELVKADKKPDSDLVQIRADLASQERQTTIAEQNLFNARLNLGRAIGIDEETSKTLGPPLDDFPQDIGQQEAQLANLSALLFLAQENRLDIKSIEKQQKAIAQQLIYTKNDLLPALDLSAIGTYGGQAFGGGLGQYFNAFGNRQGRNGLIGLSLSFSFPVNNNLAKSNYKRVQIAKNDQEVAYNDLKRNIDINVSIAYTDLLNSLSILAKTEETLSYSREVFDNEQTKFQNGLTTLLNLILFQERLTAAQLEHIQAKQQLASAIVQLRYETGTLFPDPDEIPLHVERQQFYTIPNTY